MPLILLGSVMKEMQYVVNHILTQRKSVSVAETIVTVLNQPLAVKTYVSVVVLIAVKRSLVTTMSHVGAAFVG